MDLESDRKLVSGSTDGYGVAKRKCLRSETETAASKEASSLEEFQSVTKYCESDLNEPTSNSCGEKMQSSLTSKEPVQEISNSDSMIFGNHGVINRNEYSLYFNDRRSDSGFRSNCRPFSGAQASTSLSVAGNHSSDIGDNSMSQRELPRTDVQSSAADRQILMEVLQYVTQSNQREVKVCQCSWSRQTTLFDESVMLETKCSDLHPNDTVLFIGENRAFVKCQKVCLSPDGMYLHVRTPAFSEALYKLQETEVKIEIQSGKSGRGIHHQSDFFYEKRNREAEREGLYNRQLMAEEQRCHCRCFLSKEKACCDKSQEIELFCDGLREDDYYTVLFYDKYEKLYYKEVITKLLRQSDGKLYLQFNSPSDASKLHKGFARVQVQSHKLGRDCHWPRKFFFLEDKIEQCDKTEPSSREEDDEYRDPPPDDPDDGAKGKYCPWPHRDDSPSGHSDNQGFGSSNVGTSMRWQVSWSYVVAEFITVVKLLSQGKPRPVSDLEVNRILSNPDKMEAGRRSIEACCGICVPHCPSCHRTTANRGVFLLFQLYRECIAALRSACHFSKIDPRESGAELRTLIKDVVCKTWKNTFDSDVKFGQTAVEVARLLKQSEVAEYLTMSGEEKQSMALQESSMHVAASAHTVAIDPPTGVSLDEVQFPTIDEVSFGTISVPLTQKHISVLSTDESSKMPTADSNLQKGLTVLDLAQEDGRSESVVYITKFAERDHSIGQKKSSLPPQAPSLPTGILSRLGKKGIAHYCEALAEGKVPIIRININMLGEKDAGKSSWFNDLMDKLLEEGKASTTRAHIIVMRTALRTKIKWDVGEGTDSEYGIEPTGRKWLKPTGPFTTIADSTTSIDVHTIQFQEFEEAIALTVDLAALSESLEQDIEKLRKCRQLTLVRVCDRGGQQRHLATHAALMSDCYSTVHSSTFYMYVTNLTKSLNALAVDMYRPVNGGEISKALRLRATTRGDELLHCMSAVDLAHSENVCGMEKGRVQCITPWFFIGTHKDEIEKLSDGEKWVEEQEQAIQNMLQMRDYIKHVMFADFKKRKILFEVDNTRSGTENPDPVIVQLKELIYDMTEKYFTDEENWTGQLEAEAPLSWTVVEIGMMKVSDLANNEGKMMDIRKLFPMVQKYCKTLDRFRSALKYLFSFGVIVCWLEETGLKNTVFTDPQWLFDVISTYLAILNRRNVPVHLWHDLEILKDSGKMSRNLAVGLLEARNFGVKPENYNKIFYVLQLVDIFCPAVASHSARTLVIRDATEFFVPCMLEYDFDGRTAWEQSWFDNTGSQRAGGDYMPPSLVIKSANVIGFPEPLFFRLVARTVYECSNKPKLWRNRVQVHLPADNLDLELLYHLSNCCVTVTVFSTKRQQIPSTDVINKQCVWVRRFLCWQLTDCKRRGINGFEYKVYVQYPKKAGQMAVDMRCLFEIPVGDVLPVNEPRTNEFKQRLTKAGCQHLMSWYRCRTQHVAVDEETSLQPCDLSDVAKLVLDGWKDLARVLEPRPFYQNELIKFQDGDDRSDYGQALRMLQAWKEEHNDKATADSLNQALTEAGFRPLVMKKGTQLSAATKELKGWTLDDLIDAVVFCGQDKWFIIGRQLGVSGSRIEAITVDKPDRASMLYAIIEEKRKEIGNVILFDKLLDVCKKVDIHEGVMDELESTCS